MIYCRTTRRLRVEYSLPVRDCVRSLRVFPPTIRGGQRVVESQWQCEPAPDFSSERDDELGNRVLCLRHETIARVFDFEMTLVTSHDASTPVARETNSPPTGIGAFLIPSALCNFSDEVLDAARALENNLPEAICAFAHRSLEYSPGVTNLKTSASQSLQIKRGVCQDLAHLMIALCREQKIPARYVVGYLKGEGASHAWVEVLRENRWHGFDPTHNREVNNHYVFVACGRDARDCASHEGNFRGCASAKLESWCKTITEHES